MVTKVRSILEKTKAYSLDVARKVAVAKIAPSEQQARMILFTAGMLALGFSLSHESFAQGIGNKCQDRDPSGYWSCGCFTPSELFRANLKGSLGALIMAIAGLVAIAAAVFRKYKAALLAMAVAIEAFILQGVMNRGLYDDDAAEPAKAALVALIMAIAGLVAIVAAVFRKYKAALLAMAVPIGAFILQGVMNR